MNLLSAKFTLSFSALPNLECHVLRFRGKAALGSLYEIQVQALASPEALGEIIGGGGDEAGAGSLSGAGSDNGAELFSGPVVLTIEDQSRESSLRDGSPSPWRGSWRGVVTSFETGARVGDYTLLEIVIEPSLSRLKGQIQNRVHLNKSVLEITEDSLLFGGLDPSRFKFKASGDYPKKDFVFQHEEDLLDFVFRNLEHEGLSLYFEEEGERARPGPTTGPSSLTAPWS
jgi:uncharacterized protein involved in type VI secretion and phage assembly